MMSACGRGSGLGERVGPIGKENMKNSSLRIVLLGVVCLWLGLVAWAYLGDGRAAAERADYFPYPSAYPAQFMPMVLFVPPPTPEPPTLHVGLEMRWQGQGHLYFDGRYWNPGTHDRRVVDWQIDGDTVRVYNHQWYSPNPFNWPDDEWYCHYNTTTNRQELCSSYSDPAWKWGYPWIFPVDVALANGGTVMIDGQKFDVSGPHSFLSGTGEVAYFWRMVNRERFLIWANGGEWKQYVEAGDAILFYEFTDSRILLHESGERTYYRNDERTDDRVRYESNLIQFSGLRSVDEADADAPAAADAAQLAETMARLGIDAASVGVVAR